MENLISIVSKFPILFNGDLSDGSHVSINPTCKSCVSRDCEHKLNSNNFEKYVCSKGYDCFFINSDGTKVGVIGVFLSSNSALSKSMKKVRTQYSTYGKEIEIETKKIRKIIEQLKRINTENEENCLERIQDKTVANFSLLHDIKTSIGIAYSQIEKIIYYESENKFYDKSKLQTDLYDSLELSNSQLAMINIVNNPASITYGQKINSNIFKLFHKLSNLFKTKLTDGRRIQWNDNNKTIPSIPCFESIMLIPILLLDNAIKYSIPYSTINISFDLINGEILTTICSKGVVINDEDMKNLYTKFFRGNNAKEQQISGMGIGLWMANEILKSHGSYLNYSKNIADGIGVNCFLFKISIKNLLNPA